jgi:hypothetical protein
MRDQLLLSAAILAQWQHKVASSEALDLLYWAMQAVLHQRTAIIIKMASKVGAFCCCCCCVSCCPGGRQGNTEQVVARWRRPEASGVALDMLHWAIQTAFHSHVRMAIKMAQDGGAFVCFVDFVIIPNHS